MHGPGPLWASLEFQVMRQLNRFKLQDKIKTSHLQNKAEALLGNTCLLQRLGGFARVVLY